MIGIVGVDRSRAFLQLPDEAVVKASEVRLLRVVQLQVVREEAKPADREVPDQRVLDLAEPAHELGQPPTWDAVGEQEIEVLRLEDPVQGGPHAAVPTSPENRSR